MPKITPNTAQKDERVSVELPDEIAPDFRVLVHKLKTTKGGLGALAIRFVIPKLKNGELVSLNGEIVPNPAKFPQAA